VKRIEIKLLVVTQSRIRTPDHVSTFLSIAEYVVLGDLLASLVLQLSDAVRQIGEMTNADNRMIPLHFGAIRRICPEIRIRLTDHFWLIQPRFMMSGALCVGGLEVYSLGVFSIMTRAATAWRGGMFSVGLESVSGCVWMFANAT